MHIVVLGVALATVVSLPDLVGFAIPLIVDLVTHTTASDTVKKLVNLAMSVVAGTVTSWANGHASWQALLFNGAITYLISVGSYFGWYRGTGLATTVAAWPGPVGRHHHHPTPTPLPPGPKGAPMITVAIVNPSTVLTDAEVAAVVPALQKQVSNDFASAWGTDAHLVFVPKGQTPDPAAWQLAILDNSDQAGALGYHDLTSAGQPLGKVFAGTDKQYGYNWTVTTSHELLEMLGDPDIDLCVQGADTQGNPLFYAYEACDAVEADGDGYQIDGVTVSNFVTPAWFTAGEPGPWDHRSLLTGAQQLRPGGYIGVWTPAQGWTQRTADASPGYDTRPAVGSRRERRRHGRAHFVRSTV